MAKDPNIGSEQLELELFDRKQYLTQAVKDLREEFSYDGASVVMLGSNFPDKFYLGGRVFIYDTDYFRRFLVTKEEARFLCDELKVNPFLSRDLIYS